MTGTFQDRAAAEGFLGLDQYQLTMTQLYWTLGLADKPARFEHFFRVYPDYGAHRAGYCINAGLEWLVAWMGEARAGEADIAYLRTHRTSAGKPLFAEAFLDWLRTCSGFPGLSMEAIPEGRVVHAHVPLTVVEGPLGQAQLLESGLLNRLNYPILVATKASRLRSAGRGRLLLDFGLRRGHESGATAGARAALIGGADFSSSTGLSRLMGISPKGTHAHSMVQVFLALGLGEQAAFEAYADLYPDDCLLLVDTVNTLESGIPNAIRVFERLRRQGHRPVGIRLDSGDLAYLAIRAARLLNQAGFPECRIVLSNQLDELVILQVLRQIGDEAARYGVDPDGLVDRLCFGVGTRLITSGGASALDGVYKLTALQDGGAWVPALKVSETPGKVVNPGVKKVWRLYDERGMATADLLALPDEDPLAAECLVLRHPVDHGLTRTIPRAGLSRAEPLLEKIIVKGQPAGGWPPLEALRARRQEDEGRLDPGVRRLINPHVYHVSLSQPLWELKQALLAGKMFRGASSVFP
jgi:nicotinate phosphoribosyltransferase